MSTLIYYHLGFCFMRNKWYGMKVSPIYSLFLLIIAIVFIVLFPSYVDLKSNNFPLHLLLLSMVFIMNFYWFINSYFNSRKLKLIPLDKILIWCGINSLALLGLHILFVHQIHISTREQVGLSFKNATLEDIKNTLEQRFKISIKLSGYSSERYTFDFETTTSIQEVMETLCLLDDNLSWEKGNAWTSRSRCSWWSWLRY